MSTEAAATSPRPASNDRQRSDLSRAYSPDEPTPLGGYAALMGTYVAAAGGFLVLGRDRLPERISLGDFALLAVATHKLARIVTKDWVTSPLRAPFVEYQESAGSGEVVEKARGTGLRRALGDLLTCPWCIGPWVAGALFAGFTAAPRATRTLATIFSAVAVSDSLHQIYAAEQKLAR